MKIKKIGFSSFRFGFRNISFITDPLLTLDAAGKFSSSDAEVVLFTAEKYIGKYDVLASAKFEKISSEIRDNLLEITSPGDYEVGGVIIRRKMGTNFYLLDEVDVRVMYVASEVDSLTVDQCKDLGDVDLLVLPAGGATPFASYDHLAKIITAVDPTKLVLSCVKEDGLSEKYSELMTADDFIKHAGYTHVTTEKTLKFKKGNEVENKVMEVFILER